MPMLDPLIQAEIDYIKNSGRKPKFIILGAKQLKMIENLVNQLTAQKWLSLTRIMLTLLSGGI